MPIYEYRCESCGHEMEAMQRMSDAPLTECPACGKPTLKKQISAAGFRLAGGGWYETDFKKGDKRNLAVKDSGGETKAGASAASATGNSA
ncbi:FmdB family zinc ribbon protein [Acidihalobacter ferrooxydans]|uniref:Transcriptional regulator n=1 Tax=Acidihalobacter ferrooxydans TaxID=1765967 RepID=A0A1P8UHU6_9GAMM|nr:zinc ribbon domain-containing protein [Acidihalobacter ferrooxydans]APZ43400.1 transcriptional regulator [Acidihalobacter ferrooxydans]